jgi:hypothetical protein
MASSRWARWSPLSGVLFVALYMVGFALMSSPDTKDSDMKILAHYAKSGNRRDDVMAFLFVLAAALVFIWFLSLLRIRLARAEGGSGPWTTAAFGSGFASIALWLVGVGLFVAPSAARADTHAFVLDPNTYRILNDLGYGMWFSGTTIAGVIVLSTALLSLNAGVLPKWLTWLSFVVAATMLVSFFFFPFLIFMGWVLVVSVVWLIQSLRSTPPVATQASA